MYCRFTVIGPDVVMFGAPDIEIIPNTAHNGSGCFLAKGIHACLQSSTRKHPPGWRCSSNEMFFQPPEEGW